VKLLLITTFLESFVLPGYIIFRITDKIKLVARMFLLRSVEAKGAEVEFRATSREITVRAHMASASDDVLRRLASHIRK
jgi:hypothetical protein